MAVLRRFGRKFLFGQAKPAELGNIAIPSLAVESDFDDLELATLETVNELRERLEPPQQ